MQLFQSGVQLFLKVEGGTKSFTFIVSHFLFSLTGYASGPDNSIWLVVSKDCGSKVLPVLGEEKIQFSLGVIAHIYFLSEKLDEVCNEAQTFERVIESFGEDAISYSEMSRLKPQYQRTVCKSKAKGTIIQDKTIPLPGVDEETAFTLDKVNQKITLALKGSPSCSSGLLHYQLKPKN